MPHARSRPRTTRETTPSTRANKKNLEPLARYTMLGTSNQSSRGYRPTCSGLSTNLLRATHQPAPDCHSARNFPITLLGISINLLGNNNQSARNHQSICLGLPIKLGTTNPAPRGCQKNPKAQSATRNKLCFFDFAAIFDDDWCRCSALRRAADRL